MDIPVAEDVVLGGRYRLRSLLGAGGMAEVYDGWDQRLARPVAVKLLRPDLAALTEVRRRFENEARTVARLTHPNVVAVYDAGSDGGRSYMVMERLPGETLADAIERGPLDQGWLYRLASEVLAALAAAHEAGIVHRDVKPGNILLGPGGGAKVADFGIARVAEREGGGDDPTVAAAVTGIGLVLGTPAYLAPERVMGHPATPQSDLYGLGVVLYEALTGVKPFAGPTGAAVAAEAMRGAARNPAELRPDADPQLVAVIGRALAVDPAQRYATAAQMAADLQRSPPPPPGPGSIRAVGPPGAVAAPSPAPTSVLPALAPAALAPAALAPGRRRPRAVAGILATVAAAAVVTAGVVLAVIASSHSGGSPSQANAPASSATTVPVTTTLPPTTTPTTAPSEATTAPLPADPSDVVASALQAIATRLSTSKSAAASQLAAGLDEVAAITDPGARKHAASSLLQQAVQWYHQGQLSVADYVVAGSVLHAAGSPTPPPPSAHRSAKQSAFQQSAAVQNG